jgi:predicted TIM-barrel fold metal-dependent hydrolase
MSRDSIERRGILGTVAALAVAGALRPAAAQTVKYSAGAEKPKLQVPPNAVDCHHHIYDSRYPAAANAVLLPPDAGIDDYRALHARVGTMRNVIVQPSTYGTDNRCTLDALAAFGREARAVAVVNTGVADAELKRMHDLGVRGIRFNLVQAGATTVDMLEPLSRRINDLGWHVQLHMTGDQIAGIEDPLQRLPSPIVFDHLARIPQPAGTDHPAFRVVRALLDKGNTWVKLSGAYIDTKVGPPSYADTTKLARAYVAAAPERLVWGSDWPHPTQKLDDKPDDARLLDLLAEWAPDEAVRRRILVDNPQKLYDFPKPA